MSVPSQGSQGTLGFLSCGELNEGKASVAAIKLAGNAHSTQLVERRESCLRMRENCLVGLAARVGSLPYPSICSKQLLQVALGGLKGKVLHQQLLTLGRDLGRATTLPCWPIVCRHTEGEGGWCQHTFVRFAQQRCSPNLVASC